MKWLGTHTGVAETPGLGRLSESFSDTDAFARAQPLTVRVRGVMIVEDRDWRVFGGNDLMVVATTQFGSEPPVERLVYLGQDDELGWHGDFFDDVVLSIRDLKDERLTVRIKVYDVDGIAGEVVRAVASVADDAAVLFPQLGPLAGLVAPGIEALVDLVDNLDEHDRLVDERVTLEFAEPGTGHRVLQPGYYVGFDRDVDPDDGLALDRDLRVVTAEGDRYEAGSYAVLELRRDHVAAPDREIDQRVAKLVAELNGKGQSDRAALDFLRDTLGVYTAYKKLDRIRELEAKPELTADEQALLEDLRDDEEVVRILGG
jgi:hypothetical protein